MKPALTKTARTSNAWQILRPVLAGSSAVLLISAPALQAQDQAAQNLPLSFGFSQTFEAVNNPDFGDPSAGTQGVSITALSFATSTITPTTELHFTGGLGIALTHNPDGSNVAALDSPHLGLRYGSTTVSSAVTADLSYSNDQLSRLLTLQDFVNANGQVVLPSNPADLTGTGFKQDFNGGASLEIGRDAPFGLTFTVAGERIVYTEVTDPALKDTDKASAGIEGRFSYSTQGNVTLGLGASHQLTFDTPDNVTRDTKDLTLGTNYTISPVLSVSGSATYERADATGQGQSNNSWLTLGADYTLQNGSLSFNLGTKDGTSNLVWQQKLLTGGVSVTLSHGQDSSGNGTLDQASFSYNQAINDISGLNMGLFYSSTNGSTTNPDVAATSLVMSYNHQLTKDWGMNLGANFRLRDPSNNSPDSATSAGVFLTLSRNVNFLR